jgi:signal transduction histidine kinase
VGLATTYAVVANGYRYDPRNWTTDLLIVSLGALFGLGVQAVLRRTARGSFARQVAIAALLVAALVPLFEAAFQAGLHLAGRSAAYPPAGRILRVSLFWLAPFALWAAVNLALIHEREARAREQRMAEFRQQAQAAQLRALRYQVNPHFLYNTLNSIAALILDGCNDAAERMVMGLSNFFRATLASDPASDVSLAEEVALQKLYLDIEAVRFGDSLQVRFDIADEVRGAQVPSLILQPLVENALKHGMNEAGRLTRLHLWAHRAGERLVIEVEDNGPGVGAAGGTGVGLDNVRRRLEARFGSAAHLDAGSLPEGGYRARLELPLLLA